MLEDNLALSAEEQSNTNSSSYIELKSVILYYVGGESYTVLNSIASLNVGRY